MLRRILNRPNLDELRAEVGKVKWFHTIDLGNGIVTPGLDDSKAKLKSLELAPSLRGKTVLDIGAWDGFFSFEAERRGAERVLATDAFMWGGSGWASKDGFELARRALKSGVEDMTIDVLDLTPEKVGTFDVVFFLGVLYHMRHPLAALETVANVTREQVILETHVDLRSTPWPAMRFYPGTELNRDGSNWWGPNAAAVEAMLKDVGFSTVKIVSETVAGDNPEQGRLVCHAWK